MDRLRDNQVGYILTGHIFISEKEIIPQPQERWKYKKLHVQNMWKIIHNSLANFIVYSFIVGFVLPGHQESKLLLISKKPGDQRL